MPIQILPPGHLHQHLTLLALTPALLAACAGVAAGGLGRRPGARWLGWVGVAGALAVQALFLRPQGAAAVDAEPVYHGLLRIGWIPDLLALAMGTWAAIRWRPRAGGTSVWAWCARVAAGLAMPVVQVPMVVLAAEADVPPAPAGDGSADLRRTRLRWLRFLVVVVATVILPLSGPAAAMAATFACAAATGGGPWRWWLAACALAALAPPYV